MTEAELIRCLNSLFGKDRSLLRQKLMEVREDSSKWEKTGKIIRRKTGQPVNTNTGTFEETFEHLDDPHADMYWVGDCSYYYEILLNRGVKTGLDWDRKLALKCGGTAKLCEVWASLLLPYYILDSYSRKYTPSPGEFEFTPYNPATKREKLIVSQIREVMQERGFSPITKKMARKSVPKAITDCREEGEASVFDCLFSDTQCLQEDRVRFSDSPKPIKGVCPNTTVGWYERIDRKGGVVERSTWREYPSGDRVITYLDKKFRVVRVRVVPGGSRTKSQIIVDTKKRELITKTY